MNILYIANELNHSDGVSAHLYNLICELKKSYAIEASILCGGGNAVGKFKDAGSDVYENKILRHSERTMKNFTSAILYVYKYSQLNKAEIIHSHSHYASNIAYNSSKLSGAKTVQTVHGIIPDTGRLPHLSGKNFIAVNDHVLNYLKLRLKSRDRAVLIYNGIDFGKYEPKKTGNKLTFIAASRLESGKGLDTYIKAISSLSDNYRSRAKFIIAGEGSLENFLKELNTELNAGIIFAGRIKDLSTMLKKTDVFVIPSESEGFPMAMLEAAASGNSIISSDFEGVENIIDDGTDGIIFRRNNPSDLQKRIIYAMDNPELIKKFSASMIKKAKIKFSLTEVGQRHYDFYKRLL